ncbi:hypothetical protein BOTBODRAFT_180719 [Botryobasidium botryosum FD-172 SS1]|uniref:Uncharacterized protein n=1 Tax=Botryobasidium botryosum (strain FD-172 SS1) TaxID=930990 RepID=A0A067M6F1_BOTB1|nr:hypothetical protein BOTBODRAFT_180719 [Botryobasidium botryosum FD-172 SS1]
MPVTFTVAQHSANPIDFTHVELSPEGLLKSASRGKGEQCAEHLQSSLHDRDLSTLSPQHNGFVEMAIEACNQHYHLVIRPDDVWIAILAQLNFYINAHAEELGHKLIAHEGKKELTITTAGTRYSADSGVMSRRMGDLLHENWRTSDLRHKAVYKELHGWAIPDFTTTTTNDKTIPAVILMSTLKAYFSYKMNFYCGIPSVTLKGEKSDWESILTRLDKLEEFGAEPTEWARILRPVVHRFVSAFDGTPNIGFWSKIAHYSSNGSGMPYLCGWITVFCTWSSEGKWLGDQIGAPPKPARSNLARIYLRFVFVAVRLLLMPDDFSFMPEQYASRSQLTLDGVTYPVIDSSDIPPAYCEVDVLLNDHGEEFRCLMVAGHVAMKSTAGQKGGPLDTIQPSPEWFMFVKGEVPDELPHP